MTGKPASPGASGFERGGPRWPGRLLPLAGGLLLTLTPGRLQAQTPDPGDWRFSSDTPRPLAVPAALDAVLLELEYEAGDTVRGLTWDLNQDGRPDLILRSAPSLCGASGNCTFSVVDGASLRAVGALGGNTVVVRARRIGGWPVIQTWWHMSAGSGSFTTYVFDGARYVVVSTVPVEGDGLTQLFAELDRIRSGPAP